MIVKAIRHHEVPAASHRRHPPCGEVPRADPLLSWNDTAPKQAIIAFVGKVTKEGATNYAPPAWRIAVFDNGGTLWSEQPMYFQAFFIFDRIRKLAPQHPEWKDKKTIYPDIRRSPTR